MKQILILAILSYSFVGATAQNEIEKANTCFDKKDYHCAIDNYSLALEKKSFTGGEQYLLEYRIGSSYFQLNQLDKATDYFTRSVNSNPNYVNGFFGIGDCYFTMDKYTGAIENYRKGYYVATTAAEKDIAHWWIAESYYALKMDPEALAEYKQVISREGTYYKTDIYIGDIFYQQLKYDSAIRYYKSAEQVTRQGDELYKVLKCSLGKSYRYSGNYDLAMQYQDAALAADPKYGLAMWEKGILNVNKKDFARAIDWYKKALDTYTKDSANAYSLCGNIATCYQNLKNYTEELNWQQKRKAFSKNKYIEYSKMATIQYGRLKQPAATEKICIEAINAYQLEPEDFKLKNSTDYANLNAIAGKIALEKKDTVKAQKYFDIALALTKDAYIANAGAGEIAWARKKVVEYKKFYTNISKYAYDTLLSSKKEIANVFARVAYIDAYINKSDLYSYLDNVNKALSFDSLQKEVVLLWPMILSGKDNPYTLNPQNNACLSVLNKAIKQYAADKEYVSNLYNSKAVMLESSDTANIRKALEEGIKVYPDNITLWDNLLKFYGSYNNVAGLLTSEKLIVLLKKKNDNATMANAYIYKGDFLWRLNKKEEAKKAYAEALVWDPKNATATERSKMQ